MALAACPQSGIESGVVPGQTIQPTLFKRSLSPGWLIDSEKISEFNHKLIFPNCCYVSDCHDNSHIKG